MNFYENDDLFNELVDKTSKKVGIRNALIEKDYFIYVLLKEINKRIPGIIFKGGTCLSKCFKIVDRFSEDIDLTLDERHFTQKNKRFANKEILSICDDLHFEVLNRENVINHSHANFNCYEIKYPCSKNNQANVLEPTIKVELVFKNHFLLRLKKCHPMFMKLLKMEMIQL